MKEQYPQTVEAVSKPDYVDSWWVNVNEETIPELQTLEQAIKYKPPRSRAKVLVLHHSLSNEWIPVREAESLVHCHAYSPEREASNKKDLENLQREIDSEIASLTEQGAMLRPLTAEEKNSLLNEAWKRIRHGDCPDAAELLRDTFPNCFHPLWIRDPDVYEEVAWIHESFSFRDPAYDPRFLGSRGDLTIDEVINKPSLEQLAAVIQKLHKSNPSWNEADKEGNDFSCNRRLAKALAKEFPFLVADTQEARDFFNPQPKVKKSGGTSSKAKPLIKTTEKNGKREVTITVGPWTILFLLVIAILIYKGCF